MYGSAMDCSNLNALQQDFLQRWFQRTNGYFLTGGAVLVSILGAPRQTKDLDLFTSDPEEFKLIDKVLEEISDAIGAESQSVKSSPYFRRYKLTRKADVTLVDLVYDLAPQVFPQKLSKDGVIYDSPDEILVNKICAIVGRGESRDFLDAYFLHTLGFDHQKALELAHQKDTGIDAGAMLYVLSDINWERFQVSGVDPTFVRATAQFFKDWAEQLAVKAFPAEP
jgi:hypothetical protein